MLKLLIDNKKKHHYICLNDPLVKSLLIFLHQRCYPHFLNVATHISNESLLKHDTLCRRKYCNNQKKHLLLSSRRSFHPVKGCNVQIIIEDPRNEHLKFTDIYNCNFLYSFIYLFFLLSRRKIVTIACKIKIFSGI